MRGDGRVDGKIFRIINPRSGRGQVIRQHRLAAKAVIQDGLRNAQREAADDHFAPRRAGGSRASREISAARAGHGDMSGGQGDLVDGSLHQPHRMMVEAAISAFQHRLVQRIAHHAGRTRIVPVEPPLVAEPREKHHPVGRVHRRLHLGIRPVFRKPNRHLGDTRAARRKLVAHQLRRGRVIPAMFRVFSDDQHGQPGNIADAVLDKICRAAVTRPDGPGRWRRCLEQWPGLVIHDIPPNISRRNSRRCPPPL